MHSLRLNEKLAPSFTPGESVPTDPLPPDVLLVEAEPAIADTLIYSLTAVGCALHQVTTLALARARLVEAISALVVLDLGLPDGSGLDLS